MTPAARTQAAIELLDAIIVSARDGGAAADTLIARYFAERRYAGSKDRRAVRALVYDAIRMLGERPDSGRAAMLALADTRPDIAAHFGGEGHAPPAIEPDEPRARTGLVPNWLGRMLTATGIDRPQQAALLDRKVQIGRNWPIWPTVSRVTVGSAEEMAAFRSAVASVLA